MCSHSNTFLFLFVQICSLWTITLAGLWIERVTRQASLLWADTLAAIIVKPHGRYAQLGVATVTVTCWYYVTLWLVRLWSIAILVCIIVVWFGSVNKGISIQYMLVVMMYLSYESLWSLYGSSCTLYGSFFSS